MKRIIIVLLAVCCLHFLHAQNTSYPDLVYKPTIRSVHMYRTGLDLSPPIIGLNSGSVTLTFDDLQSGVRNYTYKIIHCNYDWTPSDLVFMQYMSGFEQMDIFGYTVSQNTTTPYTNYNIVFPNEYMQPILSGNYIIKVFSSENENDVILTRRFMVSEESLTVPAQVRAPSLVEYRSEGQEVFFNIDLSSYNVQDKFNDLKVVIKQNNRWDNAVMELETPFYFGECNGL